MALDVCIALAAACPAIVSFLASNDAADVTGSIYFVDGRLTWFYEE